MVKEMEKVMDDRTEPGMRQHFMREKRILERLH